MRYINREESKIQTKLAVAVHRSYISSVVITQLSEKTWNCIFCVCSFVPYIFGFPVLHVYGELVISACASR